MFPVCCHLVAILLPLKCLIDNVVTEVATFQTMSTCKPNLRSLNINMVVGVFDGCLTISSWQTSKISTVFPTGRAVLTRRSRLRSVRLFFVILVRLLFVLFQSARTDLELLIRQTVFGDGEDFRGHPWH